MSSLAEPCKFDIWQPRFRALAHLCGGGTILQSSLQPPPRAAEQNPCLFVLWSERANAKDTVNIVREGEGGRERSRVRHGRENSHARARFVRQGAHCVRGGS